MTREHLGPISGFINYGEKEQCRFAHWKKTVETVFERFGFTPFLPRPVELSRHLLAKGGIGKQIYGVCRLQDESITDLGLPFDHTVPLAIYVAQRLQELVFPFKRYDTSWSFRGENPQAGRYRGFIQADVDIIDRHLNSLADFECVAAAMTTLSELNIGPFTLLINHIAIAHAILQQFKIPQECFADILRCIDKLDKQPKEAVSLQIQAIVPSLGSQEVDQLVNRFTFRGMLQDLQLPEEASVPAQEIAVLIKRLEQLQIPSLTIQVAPGIARGLDYYTGAVFETFLQGKESFGSIASGGRYSRLVDGFSERPSEIEGVGISIGLTRLFDILLRQEELLLNRATTAEILVGYRTPELLEPAARLANLLRAAGHRVDLFTTPNAKIHKQLDYANRKGIPWAFLVMDLEAFVVRNLQEKTQVEFQKLDDVLPYCQQQLR